MDTTSLSNQQLADIGARMLAASTFDERWAAIEQVLEQFGATSLNMASLSGSTGLPLWFRSSLSATALVEYVDAQHLSRDFIVKHAASKETPFIWKTDQRLGWESSEQGRVFANYVRDVGEKSIICRTLRSSMSSNIKALTFMSNDNPSEVFASLNQSRIHEAMRLCLPWIDWPEDPTGDGFLPVPIPTLSPREIETLQLLAGGLMNARISDAMGISEAMVAKHLQSARRKLDAKTREEAVARAMQFALIRL